MDNPFKIFEEILERYLHVGTIPHLNMAWQEPWRKYHGVNHLNEILKYIDGYKYKIHSLDYDALVLAAFFHDCYYNPRDNKNNEDESIKRFLSSFKSDNWKVRNAVVEMIETTKHRKHPGAPLLKIFWEADNDGFNRGYKKILENELLIRKEFIHIPKERYKKARVEFLKTNIGLFGKKADEDINRLIGYVNDTY